MPSPFPGMKPYLEQDDVWHDFHQSFIPALRELFVPQVRPGYIVKLEEHIYIHEVSTGEQHLLGLAEVALTRSPLAENTGSSRVLLEAPVQGRLSGAVDIERLSYLEVRDRLSRELVTVIELLSPSNKKSGADRDQYLAKRWQLLSSPAHLVEIDLLRGGRRPPLEGLPPCSYYSMVSRTEGRPEVGLWPLSVRDRLPVLPIPLRQPHPDAHLELQTVLHRIYDVSAYADYIYQGEPHPALGADDAAWARQFVPALQPPTA